jgi:hypothetical protein
MRAPTVAVTALALVAVTVAPQPAAAHHGHSGRYDASQPLWVAGTVVDGTYGYPHGLIVVEPERPSAPPDDLLRLTVDEYTRLGGRDVVREAVPVRAAGGGTLILLLPPPMTTTVANLEDRPEPGDRVGAIAYRECTTGEIRVQLLRLSAGSRVVRLRRHQTEVDGCRFPTPKPAVDPADPTASPSVALATALPTDDVQGLPLGAVAVVAGVVAAALAAAAALLARRRPD